MGRFVAETSAEQGSTFSLPSRRNLVRLGIDGFAWFAGLLFAIAARYDFDLSRIELLPLLGFAVAAIVLQLLIGTSSTSTAAATATAASTRSPGSPPR